MASLCSFCASINWDAMRPPTSDQMDDILNHRSWNGIRKLAESPDENEKVYMGSLLRMQRDSASCKLCRLFVDIIHRQGAVYSDETGEKSLADEKIFFRANNDTSYYGHILPSGFARDTDYVTRRLCLTAHSLDDGPPEDSGVTLAYFDSLLQLSDIGTLSKSPGSTYMSRHYQDVSGVLFGGRRRPHELDLSLVHSWMSICSEKHGSLCKPNSTFNGISRSKCFRVIDVQNHNIREFYDQNLPDFDYIALSYVWGKDQKIKLLTSNKSDMLLPGSLKRVRLSQSIADAMELVEKLGLQYMWTDVVCIIQDDPVDRGYQLSTMSAIYLNASFTIVAGSGNDCDAGLPGLRPGTRTYEQTEVVVVEPSTEKPGLSVLNTLKSHPRTIKRTFNRGEEDLERSVWRTRGWTMQETFLPSRMLVFTDNQVLWSCQQAYFAEETCFEVEQVRFEHFFASIHKRALLRQQDGESDPWVVYESVVYNYMLRNMSYGGDIYDAFRAVIDVMKVNAKDDFVWGLPRSRFDFALSWESRYGVKRRKEVTTLPMTDMDERVQLPSWSWMGWIGDVRCNVTDDRGETEAPTIVSYIHTKSDSAHPTIVSVTPCRSDIDDGDEGDDDGDGHEQSIVALEHIHEHLPDIIPLLSTIPNHHILFFWSTITTFHVRYPKGPIPLWSSTTYFREVRPTLHDTSGEPVGELMVIEELDPTIHVDGTNEFVMVAKREIEDLPEEISPRMVIALMIVRDVRGIARRLNRAEIRKAAWDGSGPRRELIALI